MGDRDDRKRRPGAGPRAATEGGKEDLEPVRYFSAEPVPVAASSAHVERTPLLFSLPRLGRPPRGRSGFGEVLDRILMRRGLRASQLAAGLGVTPSYLSALVTGQKPVSAERVDQIADLLGAGPEERTRLHRAAAKDLGFRLDLPDDF